MKKHSTRFWIIFWVVSAILLSIWYVFLQVYNKGFSGLRSSVGVLPLSSEMKGDLQATLSLMDYALAADEKPKTFLLLFQNNWELRPGGGFIGSFGILTIKNGHIEKLEIHDTGNFDGRIPNVEQPPYPMKEYLRIPSWQMRDSNYSPDFPTNAQKAEYFYHLGQGEEQFDGVVGVTTNVLIALLRVTGPVQLEGYPGTYDSENAIYTLEHQVEQAYLEQDIQKGDRKEVMRALAEAILQKLQPLTLSQKIRLAQVALEELKNKNIQVFFHDENIQKVVAGRGWSGSVDPLWQNDFLMLVDANLGAFKSDSLMKREIHYTLDMSGESSQATVEVTYSHTGTEKNWLINNYTSYLRLYTPKGSWLDSIEGGEGKTQYGEEFNKRVFGTVVRVSIGSSKTIVFHYTLPKTIDPDFYDLKVQKQAGLMDPNYTITTIDKKGMKKEQQFVLSHDQVLSEEL